MRVVAAQELPAGAARLLSAEDLLALCRDRDDSDDEQVVTVSTDGEGRLGAAAAYARLAPHGLEQSLQLEAAAGRLRLRLPRAVAAGAELRLWPAPALLLAASVPFLLPRHIQGWGSYVCDVCGARFPQPNPLKAHLFLRCAAPAPARFCRELLARLAPPAPAAAAAAPSATAAGAARGHRCGYCGRVYSRRYGLRIHTRTHTGHKPLRCPHCARAFADPSNLNKHVRLHKARADSHAAEL